MPDFNIPGETLSTDWRDRQRLSSRKYAKMYPSPRKRSGLESLDNGFGKGKRDIVKAAVFEAGNRLKPDSPGGETNNRATSRPRVLFISGLLSPFQVEVAGAVNRDNVLDYHVCFLEAFQEERGKHWLMDTISLPYVSCRTGGTEKVPWIKGILDKIRPEICLSGFYRGEVFNEIIRYGRSSGASIGFWGEQPSPARPPKSWLKSLLLRTKFRAFDFVLSIGDRAYRQYARIGSALRTHLVPYGQDLSLHMGIERKRIETPLRFLFSGRLVAVHNIRTLSNALTAVAQRRPGSFIFTVAARGPEERHLESALRRSPDFARAVRYDRDYERWEDRVRPFANSDILLYPSRHAGWGLVVPEAMAAGMLVVASYEVGSARFLISPGVDGLLIGTSQSEIERAVEWCLDHPERVLEMGLRARRSAERGSADSIAQSLGKILPLYYKRRS
jgi:glycosyltransferase involved in cell wall biosynthesis